MPHRIAPFLVELTRVWKALLVIAASASAGSAGMSLLMAGKIQERAEVSAAMQKQVDSVTLKVHEVEGGLDGVNKRLDTLLCLQVAQAKSEPWERCVK